MPYRLARRFHRSIALLCLLVLGSAEAQATPCQWIERLGVDIRQILEDPKPTRTHADAEQAVADQITALTHDAEDPAPLTERDAQGRTPLMFAVSGAYPKVVQALLAHPAVRRTINEADATGNTAWMLAKTAPAMTLVACQPGALTLDRYPLLPPYLRRMSALMRGGNSAVSSIVQLLEDAGAEARPEAAAQAWLARCPNAAPELLEAIGRGDLLATLVSDALDRQKRFSKAYRNDLANVPQKPPEGMRFIPSGLPRSQMHKDAICQGVLAPSQRGSLNWSGTLLFKVDFATRAGAVEAADFTVLSQSSPAPYIVDHFRGALIRALAGYQCEGDHVFEREIQFSSS